MITEPVEKTDWSNTPSTGLMDLDYPPAKPPKTFRILMLGDSHVFHHPGEELKKRNWSKQNPMGTFPKRLEYILNTMASLNDTPMRFEILMQGKLATDQPLLIWPYYETAAIAQKYQVDLVMWFFTPNMMDAFTYTAYFKLPMTPEGIPAATMDAEYMLKSDAEKIPPGLPGDFYKLCETKKLAGIAGGKNLWFKPFDQLVGDGEVEKDLVQLVGKPIGMLNEKLQKITTTNGKPVSLVLGLLPVGSRFPVLEQKPFWDDLKKMLKLPMLDLTDDFTVLRPSFFPLAESLSFEHYYIESTNVLGQVLAHELIHQKYIPFNK